MYSIVYLTNLNNFCANKLLAIYNIQYIHTVVQEKNIYVYCIIYKKPRKKTQNITFYFRLFIFY